jgi:hypothetical protein
VTLGVPRRHQPVSCSTCLHEVGRAQFQIAARKTRVVAVRRVGMGDVSAAADSWRVIALARLRGEHIGQAAAERRQRAVRLDAPPALPRPAVRLSLIDLVSRWGLDSQSEENALRFRVRAPRGSTAVRVDIRGRALDLHPDMTDGPFFVPAGSFAPAGATFHGELPIAAGEYRYGERYAVRMTACEIDACSQRTVETEVARGAYGYGDPICRLPRGAARAGRRPATIHPSPLAVLLAAPG